MSQLSLLEKAEVYITELFQNTNTAGLYYHSFSHTLSIVEASKTAANVLGLSAAETDILVLSAWFHDVGYLYTRIEHEAKSIELTRNALQPNYIPLIEPVITCIAATKVGESPKTNLAALLKDVDTAFGSAYDYINTSNTYRKELKVLENKTYSDKDWQVMCLNFLQNVTFYSDYGKEKFEPLVKKNLENYLTRNVIK
jgi:predicted metal-dependent HD superfamily phosphohydrolase